MQTLHPRNRNKRPSQQGQIHPKMAQRREEVAPEVRRGQVRDALPFAALGVGGTAALLGVLAWVSGRLDGLDGKTEIPDKPLSRDAAAVCIASAATQDFEFKSGMGRSNGLAAMGVRNTPDDPCFTEGSEILDAAIIATSTDPNISKPGRGIQPARTQHVTLPVAVSPATTTSLGK